MAECQRLQDVPLLALRLKPRERLDLNGKSGHAFCERPVVLVGQDRGGHQDRRLLVVHHRLERGADRHLGLAEPDVAQQEPVHRPVLLHILLDGSRRGQLIRRLPARKLGFKRPLPFVVRGKRMPGQGDALGLKLQQLLRIRPGPGVRFGLGPLPGGAAECMQRWGARAERHVLLHEMQLVHRHIQPVAVRILDNQRILGAAASTDPRTADVAADPMIQVDEIVALSRIDDRFKRHLQGRLDMHPAIASIRSFNPQTLETLERHTMVVILPRRVHVKPSLEMPFESVIDSREGDYLVHLDHGIGRYVGRARISASRGTHDALIVEYAGGDRLYVPMDQLHLVQKYVAFCARAPSLHTLGGTAWQRAKAKAYAGAWSYAKELLELQAKRIALPGHAFSADHEWQRTFESQFPFRETPDQLAATAAIKQDMEQHRPMDRLLLGDVGFGKTEVAIRAAFKAVMEHKQVAVLAPTTLLAYQHHSTFNHRLR